jgi:hypothetical protein
VDSSYSCSNRLIYAHAIQTSFGLLRVLSQIDIPYFDLILTTPRAPKLLAINQNTQGAIDFQSLQLLAALLTNVMDNGNGSNLPDAIKVTMKIKASCPTKRSYLFVLTDGLFSELDKQELRQIPRLCRENLIDVYGIGISRYPVGTFAIFAKCVWSLNPRYLVTAVSGFFGNEIRQIGKKIDLFAPVAANADRLEAIFKKINEKWDNICSYKDMFRELRDHILCHESIVEFQFEEGRLDGGGAINPAFVPEKFHVQGRYICRPEDLCLLFLVEGDCRSQGK